MDRQTKGRGFADSQRDQVVFQIARREHIRSIRSAKSTLNKMNPYLVPIPHQDQSSNLQGTIERCICDVMFPKQKSQV